MRTQNRLHSQGKVESDRSTHKEFNQIMAIRRLEMRLYHHIHESRCHPSPEVNQIKIPDLGQRNIGRFQASCVVEWMESAEATTSGGS